jgi:hypothetical protein
MLALLALLALLLRPLLLQGQKLQGQKFGVKQKVRAKVGPVLPKINIQWVGSKGVRSWKKVGTDGPELNCCESF